MSDTVKSPTTVDFWFDPLCAWTWTTSRWLLEAARSRDLDIRWHVMSLAILNEGRLDQIPEQFHDLVGPKGLRPVRVIVAAQQQHDADAVARLYTELGTRFHKEGETPSPTLEAIEEALTAAGLPADLIQYADTETYDAEVRASHERSQAAVGEESGSPVIAVPDGTGERRAFFGPVLTPVPRGEEAVRLWDALLLAASVPAFAELKRARSGGPAFD
ncbi:mycothiol-dependent nitroreductase Rv2466c family protein [Streptomyces turgidiscabies]|uniref:Protein-disulfide isomerase-like protein with CxxC motif n=1 Tax=Streptomyces turgidiscabies TaxID=85558 RepID=A0ABU0RYU7_9ACTN|nr:DsbA family protein [Streptomyces turgidiscabies]MDQ0936090.1 protein-disulfide isomerase-like protein with CxxC motif [Streptomyces turgidiscabies]